MSDVFPEKKPPVLSAQAPWGILSVPEAGTNLELLEQPSLGASEISHRQGFRTLRHDAPAAKSKFVPFDVKAWSECEMRLQEALSNPQKYFVKTPVFLEDLSRLGTALLRGVKACAESLGGKQPTLYQVLRAAAREIEGCSPESQTFATLVALTHSKLFNQSNSGGLWLGTARNILDVVRRPLSVKEFAGQTVITALTQIFSSHPTTLFTSPEISESLGLSNNARESSRLLTAALQTLAEFGAVVRHPDVVNSEGEGIGIVGVWSAMSECWQKPNFLSVEQLILARTSVQENGLFLCSLYDQKYSHRSIVDAARRLEMLGLVQISRTFPSAPEITEGNIRRIEECIAQDDHASEDPIVTRLVQSMAQESLHESKRRQWVPKLHDRKLVRVTLTPEGSEVVKPWAAVPVGESLTMTNYDRLRRILVNRESLLQASDEGS